jgi:hypothetical protein
VRGNQLPVSPSGGSIGPRNVLQLLFSEKSQSNSVTTEPREKISTYFKSLEF